MKVTELDKHLNVLHGALLDAQVARLIDADADYDCDEELECAQLTLDELQWN